MEKYEERINNVIDVDINVGSVDAIRMVVNDYKDCLTEEFKEKIIVAIADLICKSNSSPYRLKELIRDIEFVNELTISEWIIKNNKFHHAYEFLQLYTHPSYENMICPNYEGLKNIIFNSNNRYYIENLYKEILSSEERKLEKDRYDSFMLSNKIDNKNKILGVNEWYEKSHGGGYYRFVYDGTPLDINDFVEYYKSVLTEKDLERIIIDMKTAIRKTYECIGPKYNDDFNCNIFFKPINRDKFETIYECHLSSLIVEPLKKFITKYLQNDARHFNKEIIMIGQMQFIKEFMHFKNIDIDALINTSLENYNSLPCLFDFYSKNKSHIEFQKVLDITMEDADYPKYIKSLYLIANDGEKKYIEERLYNASEASKVIHLVKNIDSKYYKTIQIEKRIIELGKYPSFRIYELIRREDFDQKLWLNFAIEKGNVEQITQYFEVIINNSYLQKNINEGIKTVLLREDINKTFFLIQLSRFSNINLISLEKEVNATCNQEYINAFRNDLSIQERLFEQLISGNDSKDFIIFKDNKDPQKTFEAIKILQN